MDLLSEIAFGSSEIDTSDCFSHSPAAILSPANLNQKQYFLRSLKSNDIEKVKSIIEKSGYDSNADIIEPVRLR